jgi:hypothetical protein
MYVAIWSFCLFLIFKKESLITSLLVFYQYL